MQVLPQRADRAVQQLLKRHGMGGKLRNPRVFQSFLLVTLFLAAMSGLSLGVGSMSPASEGVCESSDGADKHRHSVACMCCLHRVGCTVKTTGASGTDGKATACAQQSRCGNSVARACVCRMTMRTSETTTSATRWPYYNSALLVALVQTAIAYADREDPMTGDDEYKDAMKTSLVCKSMTSLYTVDLLHLGRCVRGPGKFCSPGE